MSLPVPYYDRDGITIYCADCRDVLPALRERHINSMLTDPPYGVSGVQNTKSSRRAAGKKNEYRSIVDGRDAASIGVWAVEWALDAGMRCVVTPGNRWVCEYPSPDSFGCFYQPASVGLQSWGRADSQPILYYGNSPHGGRSLPGQSCSWQLTEKPSDNGHPCAKPLAAWTRLLLSCALPGETVVDPFMGSGTTLVAAKRNAVFAIGIEVEELYCKIAVERLSQQVLPLGVSNV